MTRRALAACAIAASACGRAPAPEPMTLEEPRVLNAAGTGGAAPMIAVNAAGTKAYSWLSGKKDGSPSRLFVMTDSTPPVEVVDSLGEFKADRETPPKLAYGPAGELYILYAIAATSAGPKAKQNGLRVARSSDGGRSFGAPVSVTDDGALGKYRNDHALHVSQDGTVYVGWLDQRTDTIRVFVTHSTDQGATWDTNRMVDTDGSCECCRVSLTSTSTGRAYIAWRKKLPGGIRDIVVARSEDRGVSWSEPSRVYADNWEFNACPDAGPALLADGQDRLHVGWWTGKEGAAGVKYARSDDASATFGPPVVMKVGQRSRPSHVQLALGAAREVLVAWEDGTQEHPQVLVRVSADGGATFGAATALSAEGQVAGYPALAVHADRFTVLWQEQSPAEAKAHQDQAPKNVDWGNMKPEIWRYYNSTSAHQVVARSGQITPLAKN